jgi:hypothetical protein
MDTSGTACGPRSPKIGLPSVVTARLYNLRLVAALCLLLTQSGHDQHFMLQAKAPRQWCAMERRLAAVLAGEVAARIRVSTEEDDGNCGE